ncbi:MAG: Mth938-like domain-containing protein [Curvibacter sp.]|nr:Mth938-like domain-containing protein [Curvibacter sp.]
MKLQPDKFDVQSVNGYGPGWVAVNGEKQFESLIISASGERLAWPARRFEDLTEAHFARLAELECEVVVFGSGLRNRFPPAAWLRPLMARRVGLETMDTQAACRTYNILAGEGRRVVAALLLEAPHP